MGAAARAIAGSAADKADPGNGFQIRESIPPGWSCRFAFAQKSMLNRCVSICSDNYLPRLVGWWVEGSALVGALELASASPL